MQRWREPGPRRRVTPHQTIDVFDDRLKLTPGGATLGALRSIDGFSAAQITFVNRASGAVEVDWLDYAGAPRHYTTLKSAKRCQQKTYLTHPWRVRAAKTEQVLGVVRVETALARPTITEDAQLQVEALGPPSPTPEHPRLELFEASDRTFPPPYGVGMALAWAPYLGAAWYQVQVSADGGRAYRDHTDERQAYHGGWINHHGQQRCASGERCLPSGQRFTYRVRALSYKKQPLGDWSVPLSATVPRWSEGEQSSAESVNQSTRFSLAEARAAPPRASEPGELVVTNQSAKDAALFWVDFDGVEHLFASLEPGQRHRPAAFVRHRFRLREREGQKLILEAVARPF